MNASLVPLFGPFPNQELSEGQGYKGPYGWGRRGRGPPRVRPAAASLHSAVACRTSGGADYKMTNERARRRREEPTAITKGNAIDEGTNVDGFPSSRSAN